MEYKVWANDHDSDFVGLTWEDGMVTVETVTGSLTLSAAEFKELRKAVGYVWQEIERTGEEGNR